LHDALPISASASADSRALIMVCSSSRIKSGDASARAWPSRPAGSTIWGAVIVMTPRGFFRRLTRRITRWPLYIRPDTVDGHDLGHRVTPLYGALLVARGAWAPREDDQG